MPRCYRRGLLGGFPAKAALANQADDAASCCRRRPRMCRETAMEDSLLPPVRSGPFRRCGRLSTVVVALVAVQVLAVGGLLAPEVPLLRGAGARLGRWFAGLHGSDVAAALSWAGFVATGLAGDLLLFLGVVVWRVEW